MAQEFLDEEMRLLRELVDKNCPFHVEGPTKKEYEGTAMNAYRNLCLHLTLGKIEGMISVLLWRGE